MAKLFGAAKKPNVPPPKPLKAKKRGLIPPRKDNVIEMVKQSNQAVENNRLLTKDELFTPRAQTYPYKFTHKVQGHDELRRELNSHQTTSYGKSSEVMHAGHSTSAGVFGDDGYQKLPEVEDKYTHVKSRVHDTDQ